MNFRINIPHQYAFQTWGKTSIRIEDREGSDSFISDITANPDLIIKSKQNQFDMPTVIPSTPEEFIQIEQRMSGSRILYEWIDKPNRQVEGIQKVRVKVTDTLNEYVNSKEIQLSFFQALNLSAEANLQSVTFVVCSKIKV
ncbi:hypothetical protein [Enterococcus faecalis]|uniref:hypothetical protein n=1 Tax=Enterococcus faecalis TaxID=1351 RepID=UPI0034CF118C